jgi:hypothetical protein
MKIKSAARIPVLLFAFKYKSADCRPCFSVRAEVSKSERDVYPAILQGERCMTTTLKEGIGRAAMDKGMMNTDSCKKGKFNV